MTNEAIEKARKLRDEGKGYQVIGDALGVSHVTIYKYLNPAYRGKRCLYGAKYRADHKEEIDAYNKQYYEDHKEELDAYGKQYYADHKEERHAYDKQYRADHKEERNTYSKQYHADHREEARLYNVEYRQTHKSEHAASEAKRRSLVAEATIGDMDQIREIYRIAREEPKVRCYLCLKLIPMGDRAVDHVFPVSKGGPFRPSALAVTHKECNGRKGAKTPEEIGLLL